MLICLASHSAEVEDKATPKVGKSSLQNLHLFLHMKEGAYPKREKFFVSIFFRNDSKDIVRFSDTMKAQEDVLKQHNF